MVNKTKSVISILTEVGGYAYLRDFKEQKIYSRDLKKLIEDHNRISAELIERAKQNTGIDFLKH
jgi:hypothetical protein